MLGLSGSKGSKKVNKNENIGSIAAQGCFTGLNTNS